MGLFDFTKKIFGSKYDKDLKQITPVIDKIKRDHFYQEIRLKNLTFSLVCAADVTKIVLQMAKTDQTIYD